MNQKRSREGVLPVQPRSGHQPGQCRALGCLVKEGYALRRVEEILPYLSASLEATNEENTRITLAGCLVSLDRRDEARDI